MNTITIPACNILLREQGERVYSFVTNHITNSDPKPGTIFCLDFRLVGFINATGVEEFLHQLIEWTKSKGLFIYIFLTGKSEYEHAFNLSISLRNNCIMAKGENNESEVLGELSNKLKNILLWVYTTQEVTSSYLAQEKGIKNNLASTYLRKLNRLGLIFRIEETLESGGYEYIYYPLFK